MADKYQSFSELATSEIEGHDFRIVLEARHPVVVLAPHGGGIEPGTTEIARGIAQPDLALYLFEGIKANGNADLHVTSHRFDEPRCRSLVAKAEYAVAVHGCKDREDSDSEVFVGGSNHVLRDALITALVAASVAAEIDRELPGTNADNLCNVPQYGGVQLEITERLRLTMFQSLTRAGRTQPTPALRHFCQAVRVGILRGQSATLDQL